MSLSTQWLSINGNVLHTSDSYSHGGRLGVYNNFDSEIKCLLVCRLDYIKCTHSKKIVSWRKFYFLYFSVYHKTHNQ